MAILGIDEVGRGPLAGPLVVGAVILPRGEAGGAPGRGLLECGLPGWVGELRDSKKLTAKKREAFSDLICAEAVYGLGWVFADELDAVGISEALRLATRRAVLEVQEKARAAGVSFSQIVIDGKVNFLAGTGLSGYVSTAVKADDLVKEVSAASIVAKVARDKYMRDMALKYPGYGFEKHVGYGTAKHMAAIRELGICPEHRKSFEPIRSMVGFERGASAGSVGGVVKNTTLVGMRGEEAVCAYLEERGHTVVARNFRTKMCEIDIVSVCGGKIYFTEVKTRRNEDFGGALGAVDGKKVKRMEFAHEVFLKMKPEYREFDPLLAVASVDGKYRVTDWFTIR